MFLHCKAHLPLPAPFPCLLHSLEGSCICSPNTEIVGNCAPPLLRMQYLYKLFIIHLQGRFVSFSLFTYCLSLCFFFFEHFLTGTARCANLILCISCFPVSVLVSANSSRDPGSFYWTMILENNIWVLGMLLLQDQLAEQANGYVYTYMNKFFYVTICICITLSISSY